MTDTTDTCPATNRDGEPCGLSAGWGTDNDGGPCKFHGGAGGSGDDHEGNDWAAKHGAYSDSFVRDFLREDEIARVEDLREILDTPEGAREDAKLTAAILKEQWRRTGDERFARRYESICDTFGIAPPDEMDVNVDGDVDVNQSVEIDFSDVDT